MRSERCRSGSRPNGTSAYETALPPPPLACSPRLRAGEARPAGYTLARGAIRGGGPRDDRSRSENRGDHLLRRRPRRRGAGEAGAVEGGSGGGRGGGGGGGRGAGGGGGGRDLLGGGMGSGGGGGGGG